MKIGYARVSTQDQNLDMQRRALKRAGCRRIYEDKLSGVCAKRAGLECAMSALKKGDVLVVWKLDRLGRSLPHLLDVLHDIKERHIEFRSLSENIDTGTAGGCLLFHVMGALAEFERALIGERTREGLAAARLRGKRIGRHRVVTAHSLSRAYRLMESGKSTSDVAKILCVGRSTLYRALKENVPHA